MPSRVAVHAIGALHALADVYLHAIGAAHASGPNQQTRRTLTHRVGAARTSDLLKGGRGLGEDVIATPLPVLAPADQPRLLRRLREGVGMSPRVSHSTDCSHHHAQTHCADMIYTP